MKSKNLWRDRVKARRGVFMLSCLWLFKCFSKMPMMGRAYWSLLIHLVKKTGLFDRAFYLDTYGDGIHAGMSPLRHYVTLGDREGRSPLALFGPDYYRSLAPGRTKYVNALLHYALVGRYRRISPSPWFDVDFYLAVNKDVARAGFDPLFHYIKWGGLEGRAPSAEFDGAFYLRAYPDVARLHVNPLQHYLQVGRFEGRRTIAEDGQAVLDERIEDARLAGMPVEESWADLKPRAGIVDATVDVVVPVYKGRAETLRCLYSVLAADCGTPFELMVIDDASPDTKLTGALQSLAGQGLFSLRVNSVNVGFVRTANSGLAIHPDRDVVLLNSDTEVFDGWLDRLREAAYRNSRTATVTPLSNNATICSYPRFLQDNPFPLELSYADLDALTATVNAGTEVEAPTGVGFCMYLKRSALEAVGLFDEAAFGRGYGEENDFCQRAIQKGWRHIVAADIFVHHWGSASFQGEKAKRIRKAMKTISRLHPNYHRDVARFIEKDPLYEVRCRLDNARLERMYRKRNILLVCHDRGGGAERRVQEEIGSLRREGCGVFLMRPMAGQPSHGVLRHPTAKVLPNLSPLPLADIRKMTAALNRLGITEIHTHSLVDFSPDFPEHLISLTRAMGVRWEINLHDYKIICPRINLADANGFYCGEPTVNVCGRCLSEQGSEFGVRDIHAWRAMHRRVLLAADRIVVPDEDIAERLNRYFSEVSFEVSPHEDLDLACVPSRISKIDRNEHLRIVVIGAIGKIKGFDALLGCAQNAKKRGLPLEFILMGYSMNDRLLQEAGVRVTGRYLERDALDRLEALSPHRVWLPAVWPETYSYTLSIALKAGLPVMAFDIGAIARRLRACDLNAGHRLIPLDLAKEPEQLADRFMEIRSRQIVTDASILAGKIGHESVENVQTRIGTGLPAAQRSS